MKKVRNLTATLIMLALAIYPIFVPVAIVRAQQVPRADTLVVSSGWQPEVFNPFGGSPCWGTWLMYPSLYMYSFVSDELLPYLAESYQWVDTYTLEVKIRKEAKWSDGTPITADDVKYTLEAGKRLGAPWAGVWDYLESVKVVDSKTVRLVTSPAKLNTFTFLQILYYPPIVPKHRWEALERQYGTKLPTDFTDRNPVAIVTGGPYRLRDFSEGETALYERDDNWWGKDIFGLPAPKYILHKKYASNEIAAAEFEKGDLDLASHFFVNIWEMWTVKGKARGTYLKNPPYYLGSDHALLVINWKEPLISSDLRRAIAFAIDYNRLTGVAQCGYSVKSSPSMVKWGMYEKWIDKDLVEKYGYYYDPNKAKQILDAAGIKDTNGNGIREIHGKDLRLKIEVPMGWTDWMDMCNIISENLKAIGIDVKPEFPDFSVWADKIGRGDFDMVIFWSVGGGIDHPWNIYRFTLDPRLSRPWGGNLAGYTKTDAITLIDQAAKLNPEKDFIQLKQIYSELQRIALTDLPVIVMFEKPLWYEYSEDYWVGFPNEENKRWFAGMYTESWPNNLPMLFYIAKKGQQSVVPKWIGELKFPVSKLFKDWAAAPTVEQKGIEEIGETLKGLNNALSSISSQLSSAVSELNNAVNELKSSSKSVVDSINSINNLVMVQMVLTIIILIAIIVLILRKK